MAYDFHGKWENTVGHNAPMHAPSTDSEYRKQLSVTNAANMWVFISIINDIPSFVFFHVFFTRRLRILIPFGNVYSI